MKQTGKAKKFSQGLIALLVFLLTLPGGTAFGQPGKKSFRFPATVTAADYDQRFVLVKLKPAHRDVFRGSPGTPASRVAAAGLSGVRELMPSRAVLSAKARKGPRRSASTVDASLYYRLSCRPGTSIEEFINELYQTGYFERIEPEYINHMFYTPNDPQLVAQYYAYSIRALDAWNITKGDENITIGIVDSGGDLTHEDLAGNLATLADPIDGIDNDGNGWIDDSQGWDFVGGSVANLNDPSFIGDNSPQIVANGNIAHGVSVAGCASGVTDNGKGIAGIGFKTRLLFTKHSPDNDPNSTGIYLGYDGMLYAALSGADIINCSWGGTFRSEIIQDMINFITNDLGVLVVAAAGNNGTEGKFYPAAYDNVLAVTAVNQSNVRASFSNYGSFVDVSAPGVGIYTTDFGSTYKSIQGTSFSSPITAGAAALVKAQFPSFTPQQLAEQLRVTSNKTELYTNNPVFVGKLGFGLLDVYSALTKSYPAVRAENPKLVNASGSPVQQGEKGYLTLTFKNILAATSSALEISISENSSFVSVVKGTSRPGSIASGGSLTNTLAPFELQLANFVPDNTEIPITIFYKDGDYLDQEEIVFLVNPTFIDVDENLVTTTVSNTGRIGYEDTESSDRTKGIGFVFDNNSILYEMGILMGTGTGTGLFNNVRSINGVFDQDFVSIDKRITESTPGTRSASEVSGTLSNNTEAASQKFKLQYRSLAWKEAPYDKFVILEYTLSNPTTAPISNIYFGLFADWDISESGASDVAKWDNETKMGYVYSVAGAGLPHAGIQLLTGTPSYFAIDNNQNAPGALFGLYDGFTDGEKFQTLNSGITHPEAGGTGNDVSHVMGSGPFTIAAGQQVVVAFALHAGHNLDELKLSAHYADSMYNFTLTAPMAVVADVNTCYGSSASVSATGATAYNWYSTFTGGQPFFSGPVYNTPNLFNDTTFYVSNADQSYESVRTPARVTVKADPHVLASGSTVICSNESVTLSAMDADSYLWSNGATTQAIQVSAPGNYTVTVNSLSPVCQNTSNPVTITTIAAPVAAFTMSGELKTYTEIQFTDQSTGAISWTWDFGNLQTSTLQNPKAKYVTADAFEVTLQISAANGCRDTVRQTLDVITAIGEMPGQELRVFPNPTRSAVYVSLGNGLMVPRSMELLTLQGRVIYRQDNITASRLEIPLGEQPDGIYLIRVAFADRVLNQKVVKIH